MKLNKIVIFLCLFLALNILSAESLQIGGEYNAGILNHPMNTSNNIVLRRIPTELNKPNRNFRIAWTPVELSNAKLFYSTSPKGGANVINNYTQAPASVTSSLTTIDGNVQVRMITTSAQQLGIGVGVYYCVIHDTETGFTSMEFELVIISPNGVITTSPVSGSTVSNNLTPTFSWQPQAGVPYYHIILSDQPFTLSYDDDDKLVVDGLNIIWQVITPNTSVQYGTPDPSGHLTNITPPPHIHGKNYNWIVLANYGNDPLYSSDVTGNPSGYHYQSTTQIASPVLTSPTNNQTINTDNIVFTWDNVPGAVSYHIYVGERRLESGSEVFYPVWDQITTNNLIEFNASEVLIHSPYAWKVVASNENNVSSVSQTRQFNYEIPVGTLNIVVRDPQGNNIGFANVTAIPLEGSMDNVPFTVNSQGREKKKLPLGNYTIRIAKTGYETQDYQVTMIEDPNHFDEENTQFHTMLSAVLPFSPAFFTGSVKSGNENIQNVTVRAVRSTGEIRTVTSSTGNYSIAVTPGTWTISAERQGYTLVSSVNSSITTGQSIALADMQMTVNTKNISGYVKLPNGSVLPQATIRLQSGNTTFTRISNSSGFYEFTGVGLGNWTVSWERTGYTPPTPVVLNVTTTTPSSTVLADAVMTPRANIVSGSVSNNTVGIANVQITATPLSGASLQTTTNVYGQYTLNLPQGNYTITAQHPQYSAQNNQQLNLSVGQTINNVNISMTANQSFITGTVLSAGNALSGVTITAGQFSTQTNEAGYYSLPVSSNTYNVIASRSGFITANQANISVGLAQTVSNINFNMSANPATITGQAILSGTGVSAATISGFRISGSTQTPINPVNTDNNGNYTLSLAAGTYNLTAQKTGLVSNTIQLTITSGSTLTNQNITMQLNQATISGTVYNDQGGVVRSATVLIQEVNNTANSFSTVTNVFGAFQLNVTAGKRYNVQISRTGFSNFSHIMSANITLGDNYVVNSFQNIVLTGQSASISGRITDQNNNNISSALVSAQRNNETYSVSSGATGNYSLSLAYGTWNLSISRPGYTVKDTTIVLLAGENITNKRFIINTNFAQLTGTVTGSNTGNPLSNVTVSATNSLGGGGTAVTNQNGQYTLTNLVPGSYTITYTRNNYTTQTISNLVLSGNTNTSRNIALVPLTGGLNITCNQNTTTLTIENMSTGAVTNHTIQAGENTITGIVTNIPLNISASKAGFIPFQTEQPVTILPNQTSALTINLTQATGQISGRIQNNQGDGLGGAQVQITASGGFSQVATTAANGNYVFNNVPTERQYTISATFAGYFAEPVTEFLSGNTLTRNITMNPNSMTISGIVRNQNQTPLANIPVRASSGTSIVNTTTNSSGQFTLTGLSPYRTYTVATVSNSPGYQNTSLGVEISGENISLSNPLVMQVHISVITGTITDSVSGSPVSGATIVAHNTVSGLTHTVTTQSNGNYTLNNLFQGNFNITISRANYQTKTLSNIALAYNQNLNQSTTIVYNAPVSVTGLVRNSFNNNVMANVNVTMVTGGTSVSTTTNNEGVFTFNNTPPYMNNILISTNLTPSAQYDNATHTFNTTNQNISGIVLPVLIKNASVSGTVSGQNNQTLGLVQVRLRRVTTNTSQTVTTLSNGQFSFTNLYEGAYELRVSRGSYITQEISFNVSANDNLIHNFTLVQVTGQVAGIVKNNFDAVLHNTRMKLINPDNNNVVSQTISSSDGSFIFPAVTAGTYLLTAEKTGYSQVNEYVVNENSSNETIILNAWQNSVIGTLKYQGETFTGEATVKAMNAQNVITSVFADKYGDFVISNITGFQRIWAETSQYTSYWQEVNISSGQSVITEINLLQARRIPGKITYEGAGISGVSVIATNVNSGRVFNASSGQSGRFALTGLPPATYLVQAFLEGYVFNETFPTIQVGSTQDADSLFFTVTFTGNTISGSAINAITGNGINNVNIELWGQQRNNVLLASTNTNAAGAFSFTNIIDGNYVLKASRAGYHEVADINVSIVGGQMTPSVVQFIMNPLPRVIYGVVTDSQGQLLPATTIVVTKIEEGAIPDSVQTNAQGMYSISLASDGNYRVTAYRNNYYPANPFIATISSSQTSVEVNFQLVLKPAHLAGNIKIRDHSDESLPENNPDFLRLTLIVPGQENRVITPSGSSYEFSDIFLPVDIFNVQLHILAEYNDVEFKELINLTLVPGEVVTYNRVFNYIPGSVNFSGYINMRETEDEIFPISNAKVYLIHNGIVKDSVSTNNNGYYQFNSVEEGNYVIKINARYNFENFEHISDTILWTGNDLEYDYTFDYILSRFSLVLRDEQGNYISGNNIVINSEALSQPITLVTNEQGYASSEYNLQSAIYNVRIIPQIIDNITWIYPQNFTVEFTEISEIHREIRLPLRVDLSKFNSVASNDSINIEIRKAHNYNNEVRLYYTDTNNQQHQVIMNQMENNILMSVIPAQYRSGLVSFYFRTVDNQDNNISYVYSNQTNPYNLTVTSEGIISLANSTISPSNALLSYKQEFVFELDINDELDNNLNDMVDELGIITWTLVDSTVGFIQAVENAPRKIKFFTPNEPEGIMTNILRARVRVGEYTINLQSNISIRDMKLASLTITGAEELNNLTNFSLFRINALSDSGFVMTIPVEWSPVETHKGNLTVVSNGARYFPNNKFIGKTRLVATAKDPVYTNIVKAEKSIDVFRLITPNNPADTLKTDNDCYMVLPARMLREGSAQIYLYKVDVSPAQGVGIENEVISNVYQTDVSGSSNFTFMPKIKFNFQKEDDLNIAWWDIYRLDWIPLENDSKSEEFIATIPGWYQYAVLKPSLALGLYDLKLLPNPFTPRDVIGSNTGLQISFKVSSNKSRYPKVTCKVYNLHGTLVRTIANNEPLLKGLYEIGGENSLYWDGYTDDKRMARNGRYIIHLIVEDSKDRKEFVKPVVLVK